MVETFRWERRFSTVVGDASRWIGRWIRPMTSLTRRGRIQSGSSSRMQSLQQLLWTEIPRDLGDGKPGPRPLRSDRYPEGHPDLPRADQLRVSKDNLACSFVLTELQALADRGGGSVRENPLRSLHWELTQEKQMMATGPWQDTVYYACCFMGARCKAQRLRHNIDEIAQWPALHCHHTQAEYTASLAFGIAVSASWWAARMGLAKLHVPRFPFVETAAGGNIGCRLIPGPSGSGQWHLQLSPLGCAQLTRKRGQGHLIGHAWWTSSWKTRPCHLGSSMWDEATIAIASQSPNGALRLFPATIATRPFGFRSMSSISCSTWRGTFRS